MSQELPIRRARAEFAEIFDTGSPTIVAAPTGSGKSTRIPVWLDDLVEGEEPVLVVEPRRVACRSLANWVCRDYDGEIGETIGYHIRFDNSTSESTRIAFVTTGIAIRLLTEREGHNYRAIVIDEFHERSWQVDLLLTVIRQRRVEGHKIPLVLTSATLDIEHLSRELEADVVEAEGRSYPVDIEYHGEANAPTKHDLEHRVADAVKDALESDSGDILVFLPGKGEIGDCFGRLVSMSETDGVDIYKVHAQMPPHKIDEALESNNDRRSIYLATNIAETSLTLPGVTTVIDSGLVRMKVHRGGTSALALVPIAEDSMDQRAGRAGRVQPGRCIRLWSDRFQPKATTPPQIERIHLDDVLLHAGTLGLDLGTIEDAPWITPPPDFAVDESRQRLKDIGALRDSGELTHRGKELAKLPVETHTARLLVDAPPEYVSVLCDLTAVLEVNAPIFLSNRDNQIRHRRRELVGKDQNEPYALIKALRAGEPKEHRLNSGSLREARKTARQLRGLFDAEPPTPAEDTLELPNPTELADYLLEIIPDKAYVLRQRARKRRGGGDPKPGKPEPWTNGQQELKVWPYRPPGVLEKDEISYPTAGLILDQFWLGRGYSGAQGMGSCLLPADEDQLARADIGETVIENPTYDRDSLHITAERRDRLEKVILQSRQVEPTGTPLCRICAELIDRGRLWLELRDKLREDLHIWDILVQWPESDRYWEDSPEPPKLQEYLADKLEQLGLEQAEELQLLEVGDIRPDLASLLDIMSYDVDSFRDDFPYTWDYRGGTYRCRVKVGSETVFIEPLDNKAKQNKVPKARHIPNFRGFSAIYKNNSRRVPLD